MRIFGAPAILGTSGDDDLSGTDDGDVFDVSQGGNDIVRGLRGSDAFLFGDTYTKDDTVFGGKGFDAMAFGLNAGPVTCGANIAGIEQITITSDVDITLTMKDAAVVSGASMDIRCDTLGAGHLLSLDASDESDAKYRVFGSIGGDNIRTGGGNDVIFGGDSADVIRPGEGSDTIDTGEGADLVIFSGNGAFTDKDHVNGGTGLEDTVRLSGDYSAGVTFLADTFINLQTLELIGGNSYTFDAGDMHPYDLFTFRVIASGLGQHDTLQFDGGGIDDGAFFFDAGAGDDVLIGGAAGDSIIGNGGVDTITVGGGNDVCFYSGVSDSAGKKFDTVNGFHADDDFFFLSLDDGVTMHTTGVDVRVNGGTLSNASFNADLAAAIGAGEMAEDHAVLFKPDDGSFAGTLFLIIDGNDVAGYQANADIVIRLLNANHMGNFDFSNFGTPG